MDGKHIDLADTNLCNFGSELELKIKKVAAEQEDEWKKTGKSVGLLIWRIEKFKVVEWPREDYGSFFDGDSYIVLHTYQKNNEGPLKFRIHMWVGLNTTKDESGTAAYKTVELDDYLGRAAVLFRETQSNESDLFLSYFPKIHILQGGVESGFRRAKSEIHQNRLYRIMFKNKTTRVIQVKLETASLNTYDAFVLDAGQVIYKWLGKKASSFEKFRAGEVSRSLDDSRKSKPKVIELEEGNDDNVEFWNLLGGKGEISCEQRVVEAAIKVDKQLLKLSDSSGKAVVDTIAKEGEVKKELLKSEDIFFLLSGSQISIWIGEKASQIEKHHAIPLAVQFLVDSGLPVNCLVTCYREGHENSYFWTLF